MIRVVLSVNPDPLACSVGCRLVFVPSQRDVHHHPIYPQPPFSLPDLCKDQVSAPALTPQGPPPPAVTPLAPPNYTSGPSPPVP